MNLRRGAGAGLAFADASLDVKAGRDGAGAWDTRAARPGGGVNQVTLSVTQGDVNQVTVSVTLFTAPWNRLARQAASGHHARTACHSTAHSPFEASECPPRPRLAHRQPSPNHPLAAAALSVLLALTAACAERHPGIEVTVSVEVSAQPEGAARVELDVAQLHIATVRGVPCGEALARALDTLQPVSRAWAHGADPTGASPLSAEVSVSVDLRQPGPQPLVTLRPPPGTWCGLELEVEPDDGTFTSLLVDARRDGAARRYLSTSTRRVRLDRLPLPVDRPGLHGITLFLDAGPTLASLEPSVNDARRDLLDTLLASMHWNAP